MNTEQPQPPKPAASHEIRGRWVKTPAPDAANCSICQNLNKFLDDVKNNVEWVQHAPPRSVSAAVNLVRNGNLKRHLASNKHWVLHFDDGSYTVKPHGKKERQLVAECWVYGRQLNLKDSQIQEYIDETLHALEPSEMAFGEELKQDLKLYWENATGSKS